MALFLVTENPARWPIEVPGAEVVSARDYLTDRRFIENRRARVYNLCRSYGYQSLGYYVSLLATARGHRPLPDVATAQDLGQAALIRIVSQEIDDVLQRGLAQIRPDRFELSIYFGRNTAKRHDRLAAALFEHFPAPLLRADFVRGDRWQLSGIRFIAAREIPESHWPFVMEQAQRFFARPRIPRKPEPRYELAILVNPDEKDQPSNPAAIRKFVRAGARLDIACTVIGPKDMGRLPRFDALFMRETTYVNHSTYRFARRAEAQGLVVIDSPESIIRSTNKVYQAEIFARHGVACPATLILHKDNRETAGPALGYPVVLKRPDSAFSAGVVRASDEQELKQRLDELFETSELVVAQEFVPSAFDWRIGVLDRKPLWACKYYMVRGHWQIQNNAAKQGQRYGRVETMAVEDAPVAAVELAVKAAGLFGDGLFGVDIKESEGRFLVMEVNDNPNIDTGCEDAVLKDDLYLAVMRSFLQRLDAQRNDPDAEEAP